MEGELELKPLDVKCTSADCDNNLHCFLSTKKMAREGRKGHCRYCDISAVDWERVHRRDLSDISHTFAAMQHELIRHQFWHCEFDEKAIIHARRKGKVGLRVAASNRIRTSVGKAFPFRDGRQTPFLGNVLYYAQHATATCCRRCIEEWHNIEPGHDLSVEELEYLTSLIVNYIEERLPYLAEDGETIPRRRR